MCNRRKKEVVRNNCLDKNKRTKKQTKKKLSGRWEQEEKGENLCQEVSEPSADKNIFW